MLGPPLLNTRGRISGQHNEMQVESGGSIYRRYGISFWFRNSRSASGVRRAGDILQVLLRAGAVFQQLLQYAYLWLKGREIFVQELFGNL